ncbi:hypothetical protein Bbelb_269060 [Branchiostoma belcheri]|nr:hypothetical protein Bbelb_269060 [Branchiostoma belcheri]
MLSPVKHAFYQSAGLYLNYTGCVRTESPGVGRRLPGRLSIGWPTEGTIATAYRQQHTGAVTCTAVRAELDRAGSQLRTDCVRTESSDVGRRLPGSWASGNPVGKTMLSRRHSMIEEFYPLYDFHRSTTFKRRAATWHEVYRTEEDVKFEKSGFQALKSALNASNLSAILDGRPRLEVTFHLPSKE